MKFSKKSLQNFNFEKKFLFLFVILLIGCQQQVSDVDLLPDPVVEPSSNVDLEILPSKPVVELVDEPVVPKVNSVSKTEFLKHDKFSDCYLLFEGEVFKLKKDTPNHPSFNVITEHCGKTTYEEEAKEQHSGSSKERLLRFADFVGVLE